MTFHTVEYGGEWGGREEDMHGSWKQKKILCMERQREINMTDFGIKLDNRISCIKYTIEIIDIQSAAQQQHSPGTWQLSHEDM